MRARSRSFCLVAILLAGSVAAHAAPVNFTLHGEVFAADSGNGFGLKQSDRIQIVGTFEDEAITPVGYSDVVFGEGSGNAFVASFGTVVFRHAMDRDYGAGYKPALLFYDGVLDGVDFDALVGINGASATLVAGVGGWEALDTGALAVNGTFDLQSFRTYSLPAPRPAALVATVLLLACWPRLRAAGATPRISTQLRTIHRL